MMSRIRVAVLMGGRSAEREVSLSTGRQVLSALDPQRYEAFPVDTAHLGALLQPSLRAAEELPHSRASLSPVPATDTDGFATLSASRETPLVGRSRPDVALICLHGRFGEDGTIQGLLELLEIPYTGSGVLASALAIDKRMAKKLFECEGIPTPPAVLLRGRAGIEGYLADLRAGRAAIGCPAVAKPNCQGSTIGISIVQQPENMAAALDTALAYEDEVLVEQFVRGIEITGPVLGNDQPVALPLVEIVPHGGFYDYEAKYTPGATDEICPARLSPSQTREAQELAVRAHEALGCRGFSRTDMMVAADGIWVLELNTIPGMTPTSLLPRSAEAAGIPFPQLVDRMIELALEGRTREPAPAGRP